MKYISFFLIFVCLLNLNFAFDFLENRFDPVTSVKHLALNKRFDWPSTKQQRNGISRQHQHRHHNNRNKATSTTTKNKVSSNLPELDEKDLTKRRKEVAVFNKKLYDVIWETTKDDRGFQTDQLNDIFNKIRNRTGSGFDFVVYNCSRPTYISLDTTKQIYLSSALSEQIKNEDTCSNQTNNVWVFKDDTTYLSTLDFAERSLTSSLIPFESLLDIFRYLKICKEFLFLIRHPAVFLKNYKNQRICESNSSQEKSSTTRSIVHHQHTSSMKSSIRSTTQSSSSTRFLKQHSSTLDTFKTFKTSHHTRFEMNNKQHRFSTAKPFVTPKFCPGGR